MSGSFYTPYSFGGGSPGSAFRSGFVGAQEIERNAQQLEEADQLMKLRQLQNERTQAAEARAAQLFPLQYSASELALKRGAQLNPLEIEKMQLDLQRLRTELGNAASTRAGGAQVPSMLEVPIIAPAPAPSPAGMYVRPPPSGGGGQASLDVTPNQYFAANDPRFTGERRFAGIQVASGDPNYWPAEIFNQGYTVTPESGPSPTAPGALPAGLLPPDQRYGAVAPPPVVAPVAPAAPTPMLPTGPADLERMLRQNASQMEAANQADRENARSRIIQNAMEDVRALVDAGYTPQQAVEETLSSTSYRGRVTAADLGVLAQGVTAPGAAATTPGVAGGQATMFPGLTVGSPGYQGAEAFSARDQSQVAPTTAQQAGVTPPGEQSVSQLTTELTNSIEKLTAIQRPEMSFISESQVGREREALQRAAANLEQRRRALVLLSRSDPGLAYQEGVKLQAEVEVLRTNEANLNGRIALSEFASGRPERLAADINRASGGVLRLEVNQDGTYNIWGREGEESPRAVNVKASDLLHQGRMMYDNNYKSQVDAIRAQNTERNNQIFKAFTDGLSETIKQRANMSREVAVKFAEEQAKAQYRAPTYDVKVDATNASVIITNTQTGQQHSFRQVPAKDRNGRTIQGQWEYVPIETRATTAR